MLVESHVPGIPSARSVSRRGQGKAEARARWRCIAPPHPSRRTPHLPAPATRPLHVSPAGILDDTCPEFEPACPHARVLRSRTICPQYRGIQFLKYRSSPPAHLLCRLEYALFHSYSKRAKPNSTDTMVHRGVDFGPLGSSKLTPPHSQAQTLEQRRRNAKFAKDQEARMGKADDQIKKRVKEAPKAPISMFWVGKSAHTLRAAPWPSCRICICARQLPRWEP